MVLEYKIKFFRIERVTLGRKIKILLNSNMIERCLFEFNVLINFVIVLINYSN